MKNKYSKLALGIIFDFIGILPYLFPLLGESMDVVWAPITTFIMMKMYKGTLGKVSGFISLVEEILPWTDFVPTFTLTWIYKYIIKKGKD